MDCEQAEYLADLRVMQYQFTPGAERALAAAAGYAGHEGSDELSPAMLDAPAMVAGLLAEPQCRGAIMLARHGIDTDRVCHRWRRLTPRWAPGDGPADVPARFAADAELSLQIAWQRMAEYEQLPVLATEHLLLGLVAAGHETSVWLRQQGLDADALETEIRQIYGHRSGPLDVDELEPTPPGEEPGRRRTGPDRRRLKVEQIPLLRMIDAAANRAREGLRTVEDYVRFVLDDRHLTDRCKQMRHRLAAALGRISTEHRLAARETQADVGTELATAAERRRNSTADVLTANLTRLQEALRSLEEFGKVLDAGIAAEFERLRYESYTLQRAVEITRASLDRLDRAKLYVLIDGGSSVEQFERLARSLIDAGVHVLQLRDKQLDDRRLLERARLLRRLTDGSQTLFIMNDRPDLAVLSRADGVHVGQEELTVKDARTVVGPDQLIGVSTHSIEQARQAVLDGANYIGVGPTFPSGTKQFEQFPGVELLRAVAAEIRLPAFAIGGITVENLSDVLATGFSRVAVGGAIAAANDPAVAAREMLSALKQTRTMKRDHA